ncbi:MAG: GTP 3',8-cyclase MoaA [Micrococcales bacterium 32-70-13]|nr:MAG: GTP 3',8-cyclase MoaA [Micrococcales bacterium 32-70-13]
MAAVNLTLTTKADRAGIAPSEGALVDRFGRAHRDLRISLTDRCSLRCTYCMPEQGNEWLAKSSVLTVDEIIQVASVAAAAGITTFRLTGGEPLLRPDVVDIVRRLARINVASGAVDVAMTTNGIRLAHLLPDLIAAGLGRLNVSIDTLDRERFRALTRRDRLDDVLAGIAAAAASDDEMTDLVDFALAHDAEMRFIEQMPLDTEHTWNRQTMVTRDEILSALSTKWHLEPVPARGGAPAELFLIDGGPARVGVIASVTAPFCGDCDRLRLTADGQLRNCLFSNSEFDLMPALRGNDDDADVAIERILRACVWSKLPGHAIDDPGFLQPARGMNAIGG